MATPTLFLEPRFGGFVGGELPKEFRQGHAVLVDFAVICHAEEFTRTARTRCKVKATACEA